MGSCMSRSGSSGRRNTEDALDPELAQIKGYDSAYESGGDEMIGRVDSGFTDVVPDCVKRSSALIPYCDDDPLEDKIEKIKLRWRMRRKNIIEYMKLLKFDKILQMSIATHLQPGEEYDYQSVDELLHVLYQNEMTKSIFCQYWKMDEYISSKQVIRRHLELMFKFQKWKVSEQLSYVNESDLELFEPYNPVVNSKTLIVSASFLPLPFHSDIVSIKFTIYKIHKENLIQGEILVVLTARWDETSTSPKRFSAGKRKEESIIKVHSFSPFSSPSNPANDSKANNDQSNNNIDQPNNSSNNHNHTQQNGKGSPNVRAYNARQAPRPPAPTKSRSPFKLKLFQAKSGGSVDAYEQHERNLVGSTSPYGQNVYSDEETSAINNNNNINGCSDTEYELISIKLSDFKKYITMQALCASVAITERELLTYKSHSKLQAANLKNINNQQFGSLLGVAGHNDSSNVVKKKLTDLQEDESADVSLIHHDEKPKHNRYYFVLCMDRSTAWLKVNELVQRINQIIDDLSFLYSVIVQASNANLSASQYVEYVQRENKQHLLSLSAMPEASRINICGGLAKYWADLDDQRSIMKRIQSALQFSAAGSVFMYPKDYAARTKWKVGDAVMIFKQDSNKWCPGKITKCVQRDGDIEVKYAVLGSSAATSPYTSPHLNAANNMPPLMQGNEETNADEQGEADRHKSKKKRAAKVTFVSNASNRGSMSVDDEEGDVTTPQHPPIGSSSDKSSKVDAISASKLAKIDFENDASLCTVVVNRYERSKVRPMVVKGSKRTNSFSVTLDAKLLGINRTSELLDSVTGLGNALRLNERLLDICDDTILAGISDDTDMVDVIEEDLADLEINSDIETVVEHKRASSKKVLLAKNVHPIALMLVEVDQLSSKINLENRKQPEKKEEEEEYDEDLIMNKLATMLDPVGKHFNQYLTANSQAGSDLASVLESDHGTGTDSLIHRISVNEQGKKGLNIKSEAFRYSSSVFALLLHNTDVAKSLMVARFVQKEIIDLCVATTEFAYNPHYLTVSVAIANLHYNQTQTHIIDTNRSWYKRCSDALKTIRYEGGNGITHADVLRGVLAATPVQTPIYSPSGNELKIERDPIGFGIVHNVGSKASEPGLALQVQNSLDVRFESFQLDGVNYDVEEEDSCNDQAQNDNLDQPPAGTQLKLPVNVSFNSPSLGTPSPRTNIDLSATAMSPHTQRDAQVRSPTKEDEETELSGRPISPTSQVDEKRQTITWKSGGRQDRKYTFV